MLSWRLSNTVDVAFCADAVEDALSRFGKPLIFDSARTAKFTSTGSSLLEAAGHLQPYGGLARQGERVDQDPVSKTHLPDTHRQAQVPLLSGHGTLDCTADGYMPMMSYASPLATACCTVATPSLRLAFWV
ncbi:hypothetical protein ACVIJ6_006120 [Bradyrhizobium sp. USDA 4369]